MSAAHTPQPWHTERMTREVSDRPSCGHPGCTKHSESTKEQLTSIAVYGQKSKWVADFHAEHLGISREECEANTALFLAAPQLIEALRETTNALHVSCLVMTDDAARAIALAIVRDARAALAAAGGVAP